MASKTPTPKIGTLKAGQKHGMLTAIAFVRRNSDCRPVWKWLCDCGKTHEANAKNVLKGKQRSCGCLHDGRPSHGLSKTPEYRIWGEMIQRCTNPDNKNFVNYGGRGIKVCERWRSFASFYEDIGPRPSPSLTIERVDNNGWYCKENCKWSTRIENASNTRSNRYVWYDEKKFTISAIARLHKIKPETFRQRLNAGWNIHDALTTKVRQFRKSL